jgi:hypothetical protein
LPTQPSTYVEVLTVPEYADAELNPASAIRLLADAPAWADNTAGGMASETTWLAHRAEAIETSTQRPADATWWTPLPPHPPSPMRPSKGLPFRPNVSLLARFDGAIVEEQLDLVYQANDTYVLVTPADNAQPERANRVASVFSAATGIPQDSIRVIIRSD